MNVDRSPERFLSGLYGQKTQTMAEQLRFRHHFLHQATGKLMSSDEREHLRRLALEIASEMLPSSSLTLNLAASGRSTHNAQSMSVAASGHSELAYLLRASQFAVDSYSPEVAIPILERVSKHPQSSNEQCIDALCQLALIYRQMGDYTQSENVLGLATFRANRLEVPLYKARVLSEYGLTLMSQKDFIHSEMAFSRALNLAKEAEDSGLELRILGNLGNASQYVGKLDYALDCYREVAERATKTGNGRLARIATANLSVLTKSRKGIENPEAILQSLRDDNNKGAIASYLGALASAKISVGEYSESHKLLKESLGIGFDIGQVQLVLKTLFSLIILYRKLGRQEEIDILVDEQERLIDGGQLTESKEILKRFL